MENKIRFFKRIPVGALGTNCYIVSGGGENAAVIDPGADFGRIQAVLDGNHLRAETVLLTHGHFDHHRAAKQFQAVGAKIYMHAADEQKIAYAPRTVKPILFKPDGYVCDNAAILNAGSERNCVQTRRGERKIRSLFPINEEFSVEAATQYQRNLSALETAGLRFTVIHTPGHTPGGVCYYLDADGILFSGDTLFHGDVGRTDFEGGDFGQLKESILNKLYALPDNTVVYPGHGEETTVGEEKRYNECVRQG